MKDTVFTIGHSTHSIEKFAGLLSRHGITAVADVRSKPYSRIVPQFNRENLKEFLRDIGTEYVFLGRELGARPEDDSCYVQGRVVYERLGNSPLFQLGVDRIAGGMESHRIAIMCAEKDPLTCHRTILVARHLVARGIEVHHILDNGVVETHDRALDRLLKELRLQELDLLRSREEILGEAYDRRGADIAYVVKDSNPSIDDALSAS